MLLQTNGRQVLENALALDKFLGLVEKKAFRIAHIATGNVDDALELVQETMLKLAEKYSAREENEWPALFYTILNRKITDWYRRGAVRNRWLSLFSSTDNSTSDQEHDTAETTLQQGPGSHGPEKQVAQNNTFSLIESALRSLPIRQQQAFMLRQWEEFSVMETAKIMKCSEGSVKTHCSRAIKRLRELLEGLEL